VKIGAGGLQALVTHELIISRNNDGQLYLIKQREVGDDLNSDHIRINHHELVQMVAKTLHSAELNKKRIKVKVRRKGSRTVFHFIDADTDEVLCELSLEDLYRVLGEQRRRTGLMLDSKV